MEKEQKEYFKSNMKILEFAMKQWKFLGSLALVAGIMAAVFSMPVFIAPLFTSEAYIYPANLGGYSGESRLEQMMQYSESNSIRDKIINKFNLYDEYEIDSTKETSKNAINRIYQERVDFDESKYQSINITATSINPERARDIVQEIIRLLDETIRETERAKYKEQLVINERLYLIKKKQVDSLEKIITEYSTKYGILDYLVQTEEVTKGYMKFLLEGKKGKDFEEVKELYENLKLHGRRYHDLNVQLNKINDEYVNRLNSWEHSLKDYTKVQTHSYVLVSPEIPDKKSSPIRWLIVLVSMIGASLFGFVILLIKGYNNK